MNTTKQVIWWIPILLCRCFHPIKKAVAEFGKFHTEITDSWCLDIDEGKKAPSDKDVRDLALDKYNIDLSKLQNMEQKIQDGIIKYLKKIGRFP
ncbi:MAG: hypothetical protein ACOX0L_07375 [Natronincolaceae bacterium]|jgi:hypothetical protein|nr:hypothetical protein [Clostridiales bacterium]